MTRKTRKWLHMTAMLASLLFPLTAQATDITSLASIGATGDYVITADIDASGFNASIAEFSGTLEAAINPATHMPYRIKNLSVPLFTTLSGTVKNLLIENVTISQSGMVGAVACTANGSARIYNVGILGGSVKSTGTSTGNNSTDCCGGLVGLLDGEARVVNCYSFANITGGNRVGGIVGYNNVATTSSNLKTMVFGCIFYGNITDVTSKAPVYNGKNISNAGSTGVGNYNYFWMEAPYVSPTATITYNCALGAEKRFLNRFEFFRHLLNSHRELAGWWVTGTYSKSGMMKWVLDKSIAPYPILKEEGKYSSVVNYHPDSTYHPTTGAKIARAGVTTRNQGGTLGTLTVNIQMGDGAVFTRPEGAAITTSQLTLNITDKDTANFNYNYYKVQLPYYNEVGSGNYTGNRVVTGWKIVGIEGGTPGTFTASDSWGGYNFADRHCTNKDLFSVSGRIFSQGAYWDVPEGVTAITIEPYWAKAAYVADAYADVVYNEGMGTAYNVANVGGGQKYTNNTRYPIAGDQQYVFTTVNDAVTHANGLNKPTTNTVNDYAVVLVGHVHQYSKKDATIGGSYRYTVTTIDQDGDNEPDYCFMFRDDGRNVIHPLKWDFLNVVGLGMAQKSTGGKGSYNLGILIPMGWFESTNTSLFRVTQFEYENSNKASNSTDALIVHGGVMEQWVSNNQKGTSDRIPYIHVGSNVWFKEFHTGCHQDKQIATKHSPISVTGGDYDEFYLTGLYRGDVANKEDNAECYINGGRFGIVCGAAMEGIGKANGANNTGNITWLIQNADIDEFYAGGLNAAKPVTGNLTTTLINSHVGLYCGGPKFGDMSSGKTVTTTATGCTFGTFFGAGYGGNSYSRRAPTNQNNKINIDWNKWVRGEYTQVYGSDYGGVSTQINYQFIPMSSNVDNVCRLFVEYVKFSLATTRNVSSTLTNCTVTDNFYGGGRLGKVDGNVTSILDGCTVKGNVFGAGFSADLPTVEVDSIGFRTEPYYYESLGTYRTAVKGRTTTYSWVHGNSISIDGTNHILYTTENLEKTNLGSVSGTVSLTIQGDSEIGTQGDATTGNVYGGGDESTVNNATPANATTSVILLGNTHVRGNVFGGGNSGSVSGATTVTVGSGE